MANVMKSTMGAVGHMLSHYDRVKDKNGEYIKFKNQDIDTTKTHFNFELTGRSHDDKLEFIHKRLSEVQYRKRKDVNVMCSWVVTAPRAVPPEDYDRFFKMVLNFLELRYGKENTIGASVHMDENTPHLHYHFVPVMKSLVKGSEDVYEERLNAKKVVSKGDLMSFHGKLETFLTKNMGYVCGIQTGITKELGGNLSKTDLKKEQYAIEYKLSKMPQIEYKGKILDKDHVTVSRADIADLTETQRLIDSLASNIHQQEEYLAQRENFLAASVKDVEKLQKRSEKLSKVEKQLADLQVTTEQYKKDASMVGAMRERVMQLTAENVKLSQQLETVTKLKADNKLFYNAWQDSEKKCEKLEQEANEYYSMLKENGLVQRSNSQKVKR